MAIQLVPIWRWRHSPLFLTLVNGPGALSNVKEGGASE